MHFSERGPERHSSAQPFRPDQAMQARAPLSRVMPTVALALVRWAQRALIEPARQRRRRRAQLEALVSLNAHLLADVGLARCDVQAALWGDAPLGRRQGAVELAPLPYEYPALLRLSCLPDAKPAKLAGHRSSWLSEPRSEQTMGGLLP